MIESPPKNIVCNESVFSFLLDSDYKEFLDRAERDYIYWDKAKYIAPEGIKAEDYWAAIKISRKSRLIRFGKYTF